MKPGERVEIEHLWDGLEVKTMGYVHKVDEDAETIELRQTDKDGPEFIVMVIPQGNVVGSFGLARE